MSRQMIFDFLFFPTLEEKIEKAERAIIEAYEKNKGNLYISYSGGKDSTVLRDIALRLYPDLPVVFSNTTNELPEIMKYVKNTPNVTHVQPAITFQNVLKKYGFPMVSKEISQYASELKTTHGKRTRLKRYYGDEKGNGKMSIQWRTLAEQDFDVTARCCYHLKKAPMTKYAKENGIPGMGPRKAIVGLMSDEGRLRQQLALHGSEEKSGKVYPFLRTGWEEADIYEYAQKRGIRFAECYYDRTIIREGREVVIEARSRTGCEFCAFGITLEKEDRFARSKLVSPKKYEKIMNIENNGVTFREAIEMVKNKSMKPKMDLYGIKLDKTTFIEKEDFDIKMFHAHSTTRTKICPRCESRDIKKAFGHYGNYADTPDPENGKHRRVFVESDQGYDCNNCGSVIHHEDMHLFNVELGVTLRLEKYVEKNIDKMTFAELVEKTGIDFDLAYKMVKYVTANKKDDPKNKKELV